MTAVCRLLLFFSSGARELLARRPFCRSLPRGLCRDGPRQRLLHRRLHQVRCRLARPSHRFGRFWGYCCAHASTVLDGARSLSRADSKSSPPPFTARPEWPAFLEWIASAMNSTAGLDASCVAAAAKAGRSPGEACTLPEDVAPHIDVPLFVMNSKYDPAMLSISSTARYAPVALTSHPLPTPMSSLAGANAGYLQSSTMVPSHPLFSSSFLLFFLSLSLSLSHTCSLSLALAFIHPLPSHIRPERPRRSTSSRPASCPRLNRRC